MLFFTDEYKARVEKTPLPFIDHQYLTNAVLHSSNNSQGGAFLRCNFFGEPIPREPPSAMLRVVTNDESSAVNSRVDTTCGRFLTFAREQNHIRAGNYSPADAVYSVYQYFLQILASDKRLYPCTITVPNIVSTGEFSEPLDPNFSNNGLITSSNKFPGFSCSLSTGATPVVYPGKNGTNKKFIVPGMFTVDQALETINRLHAITHLSAAAVPDPKDE
tara:strand:- start:29 stop:682 length:654 start_codon:yes stop_codon:yes gene_type:complete